MENIIEVRQFIKRNKISMVYLKEYMGYSYVHISAVLNKRKNGSLPFTRILYLALMNHAGNDENQFTKCLEELWGR